MDNVRKQVEDILKNKNVTPAMMTEGEFGNEVFRRLNDEVPELMSTAVERIANEVMVEEMEQVGREIPCRFTFSRKKCADQGCYDCPSYQPAAWWRRNKIKLLAYAEVLELLVAISSFVIAVLVGGIGLYVLIVWFMIVVVSRLQVIWLYSLVNPYFKEKAPKWIRVVLKRE